MAEADAFRCSKLVRRTRCKNDDYCMHKRHNGFHIFCGLVELINRKIRQKKRHSKPHARNEADITHEVYAGNRTKSEELVRDYCATTAGTDERAIAELRLIIHRTDMFKEIIRRCKQLRK